MRRQALAALAAVGLLGCASTTLRSGEPPGKTAAGMNEKWHAGFLFGTIRAIEPYELARGCPHGWSEIRVEPDPFTLLAGAVTLFMYSPSRVTVVCARRPGDEALDF